MYATTYAPAAPMYVPPTIDRIKDSSVEENWKMARYGKFTASSIHHLLSKGKGTVFGKGALTYINEIACDAYTGFEDSGFESYDMKMGKILEPQAVAYYQKIIGVDVMHYGDANPRFQLYCKDSGGSPDALVFNASQDSVSFGAEFKCPKRKTHWDYIMGIKNQYDLLDMCEEYYTQVQFLMEIFKCDLWHWSSYNDYFPIKHKMHIIEVKPDKQFMDNLLIRLRMAIKMKYELIEELKAKG